ncbi:MAG: DMT family transporter [Pseudomonadota bacterium]
MKALAAAQPRQDRLRLAVALSLAAFFCFTMIDTLAKALVATLPALQVVFIRYAGHFAFSLAVFVPREGLNVFRSHAPALQMARATLLLAGTSFNFLALKSLPLTFTTAVFFASPIVVCLLSIPLLGEKVGARRLAAVFVGFIGVLIIVQPGSAGFEPAMLYSLGALLSASLYFVLTRRVAGRDDNPTGQIYTSALPTLALAPFVIPGWIQPVGLAWIPTLLIGIFGGLGHSLFTVAHRYGEASVLAPIVYVQILYATAISWLVFAHAPAANTILGTAVIVASGFYIWLRERQKKPNS